MKDVKIGSKIIGKNYPIFISAEVGVTCNYDMIISKELIDVTAEAGADAIKFIFWFPDEILSDKTMTYSYQTLHGPKTENMYEMVSKFKFSIEQWFELKEYADKKGVILFSTVNSPSGIDYAQKIGLEAFKLSSWDFNYLDLWKEIAKFQKPMIIDTGPADIFEIEKVMKIIRNENATPLLVHCFHTNNYEEMNMKSMPYMKNIFKCHVGFSSSNTKSECDILSIAFGGVYLEKRLTLSRKLPGHHHILSKEPKEFIEYVKLMRNIQKSIGEETIIPSKDDLEERKKWFRRLVATKNLIPGEVITKDMLIAKRPEVGGISPEHVTLFIGKKINRAVKKDEPIQWNDLQG
jgi:N,N'-diacetyllegionaminate synthase